jgi:DNA-binding NarL/FixJ family response regulator
MSDSSGTTDIFFVEDNEVIRFCLRVFLKKIADFNLVGEAAEGATALAKIVELNPRVALVDIGLPGISGIELTKTLKSKMPDVKVLILTASESEDDIFAALDAGADGYVLKREYSNNLEIAIRSVRVGAVWLDPAIARQVLKSTQRKPGQQQASPALSAEEHTVLTEVAESSCSDGVCLVDPQFLHKLKRFSREVSMPKVSND